MGNVSLGCVAVLGMQTPTASHVKSALREPRIGHLTLLCWQNPAQKTRQLAHLTGEKRAQTPHASTGRQLLNPQPGLDSLKRFSVGLVDLVCSKAYSSEARAWATARCKLQMNLLINVSHTTGYRSLPPLLPTNKFFLWRRGAEKAT